jgi:hypothetical protein
MNKKDIGRAFLIGIKRKEIRGGIIIGEVKEVNEDYVKLYWEYPNYECEINQEDILYALEINLAITGILDEESYDWIPKEEWDKTVRGLKRELYRFYYLEEPNEIELRRKLRIVIYYINYKPSVIHLYLEGTPPKGELFIFEGGEVMILGNRRFKIGYGLPKRFEKYYDAILVSAGKELESIKKIWR